MEYYGILWNVMECYFNEANGRMLINSFLLAQEKRIFFKFLTLLSNLQKSESRNSSANI